MPPERVTGPLQSVPSLPLKVTVPVGVPEPGVSAETVAVRVTDCPTTGDPGDTTSAVEVPSMSTSWDSAVGLKEPW